MGGFITFEGGEGAGKSTQLRMLHQRMEQEGLAVKSTREPGGSDGAEAIRNLIVTGDVGRWDGITEVLLLSAARRDHLVKTIWPSVKDGYWVLCDRFVDSTVAYQGYGHGLDSDVILSVTRIVMGDFQPDLTIILDLPVEIGLKRAVTRGGGEDRFERMNIEFHERLQNGFLQIAHANPQRCATIDANADPEQVHENVWRRVQPLLTSQAR